MRISSQDLHYKLLKKIRPYNILQTSKKQPQSKNKFSEINKTASKKLEIKDDYEENDSQYSKQLTMKIGLLKECFLRQDYYECTIEVRQTRVSKPYKICGLVDQDKGCRLWVGCIYYIQQIEELLLADQSKMIFLKLKQVVTRT